MADGGGRRRWQDEVEPELRPRMARQLVATMEGLFKAVEKSPPENFHERVANLEMNTFNTAKDKMDYMMRLSERMLKCQKNTHATASHQQRMQMAHQIQLHNTDQAVQGGNSSLTTIPQAAPMMAFQSPDQHLTCPSASNTQINVNPGPSDMMATLYQTFSSQPSMFDPMAQSVQPGQQIMQSIAMQNHNQHPAMQLQPTNIAQCLPASMEQLQGPNGHQNHLISKNVCTYAQNLQPTVQQQYSGITQQQVDMQRYQMLGANSATMNDGYSCGWNNQQNTRWASEKQSPLNPCKELALKRQTDMEFQSMFPIQRQIIVNQQSNMHSQIQQNQARLGSAGEEDWREEMIQQSKSWKDAYFSELLELDQNIVVQTLTEEQLKSLSREEADKYNHMVSEKRCLTFVLEFLQLEKSLETYKGKLAKIQEAIHVLLGKKKANAEINTGQESNCCSPQTINFIADIAPLTNGKSNQQKLPADESIGQLRQIVVTTPSSGEKTLSNQLQGVTSPCFSIKSPKALWPSPIKDVGLCCTSSSIDKLRVASPNSLLKSRSQSPTATQDIRAAGSPCASVKSASPSAIPKSSPSDSDSSFFLHNKAAVNGCKQTTPTKLWTPDSPCQKKTPAGQSEDQEDGRDETPVAKKPIDRLTDALRSSSPAVLRSSVKLIKSALSEMDSVPLFGSNNKMKRVYDVTSPSESPTLGSMDGSTMTFESDASDTASSRYQYQSVKRLKTQSTKDALLDEIEAVNRRLIDTVISITNKDREVGITSCNSVTLIKLSYTAVSLGPNLKSRFVTPGDLQHLVMPLTLLIPADYPRSSPVIVDYEGDAQLRTKFSCISVAVDAAFQLSLPNLQEPRSLKEMATVWDSCVRHAVMDYAYRLSGGALSSKLVRCEGWVCA